jgi:hypothetical protein
MAPGLRAWVVGIVSGAMLAGAAMSGPAEGPKRSCDEIGLTDQQLQDAYAAADARLRKSGRPVDSLDSPNFVELWKLVGEQLGCAMPVTAPMQPAK